MPPMVESKFTRWDEKEHHPRMRCEGSSQTEGQCPFLKIEGSNYCIRHGGHNVAVAAKKAATRNYQLTRWKTRVHDLADNDSIKSLREEVGILRMVMETMLNHCEDATDILLYSARLADLTMKIDKLVNSCDKMESKMGLLLSKDSVLQLAGTFVEIINRYVEDPEVIDVISTEMVAATLRTQNPLQDNNAFPRPD